MIKVYFYQHQYQYQYQYKYQDRISHSAIFLTWLKESILLNYLNKSINQLFNKVKNTKLKEKFGKQKWPQNMLL